MLVVSLCICVTTSSFPHADLTKETFVSYEIKACVACYWTYLKDYCAFNKQNTLMQGDLPSVTERDFSILTCIASTLASVMTAVSKSF